MSYFRTSTSGQLAQHETTVCATVPPRSESRIPEPWLKEPADYGQHFVAGGCPGWRGALCQVSMMRRCVELGN